MLLSPEMLAGCFSCKINDYSILQLKHPASISGDSSMFPPSDFLASHLL